MRIKIAGKNDGKVTAKERETGKNNRDKGILLEKSTVPKIIYFLAYMFAVKNFEITKKNGQQTI